MPELDCQVEVSHGRVSMTIFFAKSCWFAYWRSSCSGISVAGLKGISPDRLARQALFGADPEPVSRLPAIGPADLCRKAWRPQKTGYHSAASSAQE